MPNHVSCKTPTGMAFLTISTPFLKENDVLAPNMACHTLQCWALGAHFGWGHQQMCPISKATHPQVPNLKSLGRHANYPKKAKTHQNASCDKKQPTPRVPGIQWRGPGQLGCMQVTRSRAPVHNWCLGGTWVLCWPTHHHLSLL